MALAVESLLGVETSVSVSDDAAYPLALDGKKRARRRHAEKQPDSMSIDGGIG